jgi:hypothetical protein
VLELVAFFLTTDTPFLFFFFFFFPLSSLHDHEAIHQQGAGGVLSSIPAFLEGRGGVNSEMVFPIVHIYLNHEYFLSLLCTMCCLHVDKLDFAALARHGQA